MNHKAFRVFCEWFMSSEGMRKIHGWATVLWFAAAFPTCIYLKDSVPFLVFVSVYAVVTGHWSSWQAARVETKQDEGVRT